MATKILLRRDQSWNWQFNNPILAPGEIGYELDTGRFKWGQQENASDPNSNRWNQLPYYDLISNLQTAGKLSTPRKIELNGQVTGFTFFDGSSNVVISTTLNMGAISWNMITNKPSFYIYLQGEVLGSGYSSEVGDLVLNTQLSPTAMAQYLTWSKISNKPSPKITLVGDIEGEGIMNQLGDVTITTKLVANSLGF